MLRLATRPVSFRKTFRVLLRGEAATLTIAALRGKAPEADQLSGFASFGFILLRAGSFGFARVRWHSLVFVAVRSGSWRFAGIRAGSSRSTYGWADIEQRKNNRAENLNLQGPP
jgi:hypothetical protein